MASGVPSSAVSRFLAPLNITASSSSSPPETNGATNNDNEETDPTKLAEIEEKYARLNKLLDKSRLYSDILFSHLKTTRAEHQAKQKAVQPTPKLEKSRKRVHESDIEDDTLAKKKKKKISDGTAENIVDEEDSGVTHVFSQPALVTGAQLKDYQLEGLQWMISLHQNGISGILADEMGLGKTLQTISFSAYLRESNYGKPFLVVCPLSVLSNWVDEYNKFTPDIPVCRYHGTPEERSNLRRTVLGSIPRQTQANTKVPAMGTGKRKTKGKRVNRKVIPIAKPDEDPDEGRLLMERDDDEEAKPPTFPIVVTTFEMIMKDRAYLATYDWGYIVVDEGHRLKNLDSKLMREIKKYNNASRMILTGTPLHNNLTELWALLNFVLPDLFNDVEQFEEWFSFSTMKSAIGSTRANELIGTLHAILKPFLLRRLKADVEQGLPAKKEYVLYAPLSVTQRKLYDKILDGTLRTHLMSGRGFEVEPVKSKTVDNEKRKIRLGKSETDSHAYERKTASKEVNNMKLQNTVMQLRKACSHPYLFDWPVDTRTRTPILDERVVLESGKMMILERLLDELFRRKHKVLLFSQFTSMLDIIDDWAREIKKWNLCRIDGSTSPIDRKAEMNRFQTGENSSDAPCLFLLSTRAGGLGINLVAADTVIFYDQDWNPQMDAQAQDRAHRIGQKRPVLIFRIACAHTIETKIMERASEKKKLEALVIAKGKFKAPITSARQGKDESFTELSSSLFRLEGEIIDVVQETGTGKASVISDRDLDALLDRSVDVFTGRGNGWTSENCHEHTAGAKTAFAVYEAPKSDDIDILAELSNGVDSAE